MRSTVLAGGSRSPLALDGASKMKLTFEIGVVETDLTYQAACHHRANKHSQAH